MLNKHIQIQYLQQLYHLANIFKTIINGKTLHNRKRQRDTKKLLSDLKESKKTIRILHGEAGVGKSRILDTFYYLSEQNNSYTNTYFVGYYDKSKSLIVEAISICIL